MIVFAAIGEFFGLARQVVEIDQGLRTWGQFSPLDALWTAGAAGLIPFAPILIPIFGVAGVGSAGYQLSEGNYGLAAFDGLFSLAGFRGWQVSGFSVRPSWWPVKGITPASSGTGTPNPAPTIVSGKGIPPTPGEPGGAGGQQPGRLDLFPPGARAGTGEPNGNPSQPNVPNVRPTPEEVTVGATSIGGTQKGQVNGDGAEPLPNTPKAETPQEVSGASTPTPLPQTRLPLPSPKGYQPHPEPVGDSFDPYACLPAYGKAPQGAEWTGTKQTTGVAVYSDANGQQFMIFTSGHRNSTVPTTAWRGASKIPGMTDINYHHAEPQMAYFMRRNPHITEAEMWVNHELGPCTPSDASVVNPMSCDPNLNLMLLPGQKLTVRWIDANGIHQSKNFQGAE